MPQGDEEERPPAQRECAGRDHFAVKQLVESPKETASYLEALIRITEKRGSRHAVAGKWEGADREA